MSEERPQPFEEGQVLEGRYRVERVLGVGGMGVVVQAHHLHLDEPVALKFILPERATDPTVVERFLLEARAAAKIRSEHVVRVFDAAKLENGTPYLVMELVEGEDLNRAIKRGPLDVSRAAELILQASEALAEAHALGIVHRDLKPANLFLTHRPDGTECIKVLDFGISKLVTAAPATALTETQHVLASPPYMSPEQLSSSKSVDQRTDIWALGVTLFELVTGKRPFNGGTLPELCVAILTQDPEDFHALRAELPDALHDVFDGCFEKDAALRFPSLVEFSQSLLVLAPGTGSVERIRRVLAPKEPKETPAGLPARDPQTESIQASVLDLPKIVPNPTPTQSVPPPRPPAPARRAMAVVIGLVLGVIAIGLAVVLMKKEPPPAPTGVVATPLPSASLPITIEPPPPPPPAASSIVPAAMPPPAPAPAAPKTSAPTRADQKGLAGDNPFR